MSIEYHETREEHESYEEESKMTIEGINDDRSLNGSHHLIVEFIKAVTNLDEANMIITGFTGEIHFIRNHDVDVTEVTNLGEENGYSVNIDTHELEWLQNFQSVRNPDKQKLLKFIDSYAVTEKHSWMDEVKFKEFIAQLVTLASDVYNRKIVLAAMDSEFCVDVDDPMKYDLNQLNHHDINTLFNTLELKYKIRMVNRRYKVDRI